MPPFSVSTHPPQRPSLCIQRRNISAWLLLDFIVLGLCSPLLVLLIYGSSYELWGYFGPYVFALAGGLLGMIFLVMYLIPQRVRRIVRWCAFVALHGYLLYYALLFLLMWLTGLPPWRLGASPWT